MAFIKVLGGRASRATARDRPERSTHNLEGHPEGVKTVLSFRVSLDRFALYYLLGT